MAPLPIFFGGAPKIYYRAYGRKLMLLVALLPVDLPVTTSGCTSGTTSGCTSGYYFWLHFRLHFRVPLQSEKGIAMHSLCETSCPPRTVHCHAPVMITDTHDNNICAQKPNRNQTFFKCFGKSKIVSYRVVL